MDNIPLTGLTVTDEEIKAWQSLSKNERYNLTKKYNLDTIDEERPARIKQAYLEAVSIWRGGSSSSILGNLTTQNHDASEVHIGTSVDTDSIRKNNEIYSEIFNGKNGTTTKPIFTCVKICLFRELDKDNDHRYAVFPILSFNIPFHSVEKNNDCLVLVSDFPIKIDLYNTLVVLIEYSEHKGLYTYKISFEMHGKYYIILFPKANGDQVLEINNAASFFRLTKNTPVALQE